MQDLRFTRKTCVFHYTGWFRAVKTLRSEATAYFDFDGLLPRRRSLDSCEALRADSIISVARYFISCALSRIPKFLLKAS
jgi:hypothetical protein